MRDKELVMEVLHQIGISHGEPTLNYGFLSQFEDREAYFIEAQPI